MVRAIEASGAEIVTVAVRRVDLDRSNDEGILHHLRPDESFLLANTAGCYNAEDAIRYARLAREAAGFNECVKLEVIGDQDTLLPDTAGHLEAARTLAAEGFKVWPTPTTTSSRRSGWRTPGAWRSCPWPAPSGAGSAW